MTNPPPPGQEGYGQGASGYDPSGAGGYGSPADQWAGNPPSAVGPGAYVPPPDRPVVAYPPAYYAPPAANYLTPGYGYGYGYGAPYGYLGQYQPSQGTDGMAIASLVLSCAAVLGLCAWGFGGLPLGALGAIFGHVAKHRIRNSGAGGDGLALAGIIVGWISAVLGLIALGLVVTLIVMDPANATF